MYECLAGPLPGSPRSWFFLIVVLYVLLDRCHLRDLRMTGYGPLSRSGGTANIVHSVCCSWNQVSGRRPTENTCWGFNHSAFWLWAKLLWSVSVTARYLASYTWYLRSCTCSLMLSIFLQDDYRLVLTVACKTSVATRWTHTHENL